MTEARPLPQPLPPAERTVGQLVAESIRLYGRRFLLGLALGVAPAVVDAVASRLDRSEALVFAPLAGALLLTPAYVAACAIAYGVRPSPRTALTAFAVGAAVFLPFPLLTTFFVLPGLVWLAFFGLAVPVAVVEGRGFVASLGRALRLARADYVHALGSLSALAIVVFATRAMLFVLLEGFGDAAAATAAFLADLVISPLLFFGAALLYDDQRARLEAKTK